LCALVGLLADARAAEPGSPEPVQAIWKHQEFSFFFHSQTTFYSCSSLEAKLKRILRALGAQSRVKVRSIECLSSPGIARAPRVTLNVVAPVEATPDAVAERDKDKSTRELAARVRGEAQDPAYFEPFPAQWKRVSVGRGRPGLEPGDCDLLDQVRRQVLPKLAVRVLKDQVHCPRDQVSVGQPQLEVEALVALPKPDEKPDDKADEKPDPK
jgi:hypothetical protein